MNELHVLTTLALVHLIALMSPGPDFALVVQNVSRYGRATGVYIAIGLSIGILTHAVLSITGVSFLISQHPWLHSVLQIAGGSYLLYLGVGALIGVYKHWHHVEQEEAFQANMALATNDQDRFTFKSQAFLKGLMTNLLNPKALVFFTSLMSSLIPADSAVTIKGAAMFIIWLLSLLWFAALAWLLSTPKPQELLRQSSRYIDLLCGLVFTVIGSVILYP